MKLSNKELDKLISIWHEDKSILCDLHEFLGWSKADYGKWVKSPGFKPESDLDRSEIDFIFRRKVK